MEAYALQFLASFLSTVAFVACIASLYKSHKPKTRCEPPPPPQAGGSWPIIGHLPQFHNHQLTHITLSAMADRYGSIFTVKLGSHRALVVSGWEVAKDCFTVHDKAFAGRPVVAATRLLGYNCAMFGFAPYGTYWREMRKFTMHELLSNTRIDKMKHMRASEVGDAVKDLYEHCSSVRGSSAVDMKRWLGDLSLNVALRSIIGKQYRDYSEKDNESCRGMIRNFFRMFGVFVLSDLIPMLGWWDKNGYMRLMRDTAREMDVLVGGWLEERKRKRLLMKDDDGTGSSSELSNDDEKDFMDVLMDKFGRDGVSGFDANTVIKATSANMLIAATDATTSALVWALSLLLNNPDTIRKAREELDAVVGRDRRVEESDIGNLVYLQAVVKETLRLYPPVPINGFREVIEECTITSAGNDYHVPVGTRLLLNVWKIQRDSRVWSEPDEFKPERFLTEAHKNVDVMGHSFELLPFGSGRRVCAGISLGLRLVHLVLASLLQGFEVGTVGNEKIDMTESSGLVNLKATPLEVLVTPRLDSNLYAQ